jgi:uncharacterized protein (DUF433 family)
MVTVLNISEIVSDPTIRGGRPVLAGTGIRVVDIVGYHLYGDKLSPEQIVHDFRLPLGQVHAALAYYFLHQEELDEQMQKDVEEAEQFLAELERQGKAKRLE